MVKFAYMLSSNEIPLHLQGPKTYTTRYEAIFASPPYVECL